MNRKLFFLALIGLIGISSALITAAYYTQLSRDYYQLMVDYDHLEVAHYILGQAYSTLEAVKGLVIDETINITVNTEHIFGRGYTVKGNVTNIGDAPIPTLYVLIFIYRADGSLWDIYEVMVNNLYQGETNAYEFFAALPDESYKFKMFAVGNYN